MQSWPALAKPPSAAACGGARPGRRPASTTMRVVARPLGDVGAQPGAGGVGRPEAGQVALAGRASRRGRRRRGRRGSQTSGSASGPGRSTRPRSRPRGQAPARASSTSARGGGARARRAAPDDRVAGDQRRGGHHRRHPDRRVGRVPAEHHPVGRPLQRGRPRGGRHRAGPDRLRERRQGVEQAERRGQLAPGEAPRLAGLRDRSVHDLAARRPRGPRGACARAPGARRVERRHLRLGGRGALRPDPRVRGTATTAQLSEAGVLPPGLLVEGDEAALAAAFAALAPLQPVALGSRRPRLRAALRPRAGRARPRRLPPAPDRALARRPGLARLRPRRWLAGWYRRSPAHAPAPAGVRELLQAPGEGFGPAGHATTAMCLEVARRPARAVRRSTPAAARACWPRPGSRSDGGRCSPATSTRAPSTRPPAAWPPPAARAAWPCAGRPWRRLRPRRLAGAVLLANVPLAAHARAAGRASARRRARRSCRACARPSARAVEAAWRGPRPARRPDAPSAAGFVCAAPGAGRSRLGRAMAAHDRRRPRLSPPRCSRPSGPSS